jgi:hypothetical protein
MHTHRQQKLAARVAGCELQSSIVSVETGVHSSFELNNSTASCSMQKSISECSIASPDFGVSGGEASLHVTCRNGSWALLLDVCLYSFIIFYTLTCW